MGHLISRKANSLAVNLFKMELAEEAIKEVQERESSAVENFKWDSGLLGGSTTEEWTLKCFSPLWQRWKKNT